MVRIYKRDGEPSSVISLISRNVFPDAEGRFLVTEAEAAQLQPAGYEIDHSPQGAGRAA